MVTKKKVKTAKMAVTVKKVGTVKKAIIAHSQNGGFVTFYISGSRCIVTIMVHSVPTGQLVFSSRPVGRTVRYVIQLVNTSGQVGEYFIHRVRQFI